MPATQTLLGRMAAPKPASPWERHGTILQLDAQVPGKIRTSRTHLLGEQRCTGASRITTTALPVTYESSLPGWRHQPYERTC